MNRRSPSSVPKDSARTVIVTGGAGFIGSALVRHLVMHTLHRVVTVDALTYAADPRALDPVQGSGRHTLEPVDVCDGPALAELFARHRPDAVVHLAAESHVDRSIERPADFVRTNVVGTATLLDTVRDWLDGADSRARRDRFRFVHVSTDEVYGSLGLDSGRRFDERSPYDPHSPYAASKAASDHFARAWAHTYGLPVVLTHSTNNYGPWQYPEKLIPVVVLRALAGEAIPVYGTGENVRDWMHVDDHVRGLAAALERGRVGETYDLGARCERTNLSVVLDICALLDEFSPGSPVVPHRELIRLVRDRPGHDLRYATDSSKAERELGWRPEIEWAAGLRETVRWMVRERAALEARLARAGSADQAGAAASGG
jgi:dTDP-glucose 4,6-dehydratase